MSKFSLLFAALLLGSITPTRAQEPLPPGAAPNPPTAVVPKDKPWETEIRAKLKKPVTFEFVDAPLGDALKFLDAQSHVTIVLDPKLVADGADKTAVNLRVKDMEVGHALKWLLQLAELDYTLRDEAVFVLKDAKVVEPLEKRIYDIGDLALVKAGGAAALNDLIRLQIRPESWDAASGSAIEERDGKLVIMQTSEIHGLITELLRVKRGLPPAAGEKAAPASVPDKRTAPLKDAF